MSQSCIFYIQVKCTLAKPNIISIFFSRHLLLKRKFLGRAPEKCLTRQTLAEWESRPPLGIVWVKYGQTLLSPELLSRRLELTRPRVHGTYLSGPQALVLLSPCLRHVPPERPRWVMSQLHLVTHRLPGNSWPFGQPPWRTWTSSGRMYTLANALSLSA